MYDKISSVHNQHVKDWKKLQTHKGREQAGSYLLDGWHLVQEACQSEQVLDSLIGTPDELEAHKNIVSRFQNVFEVSDQVMNAIAGSQTPQGIAAIAKLPDTHWQAGHNLSGAWLMLDRVQDPGNVGTMVRTADAAGFAGVVASSKTADFFSPKVVRSMQGSQFHLQLVEGDLSKWIQDFKNAGLPVYGSELNPQAKSVWDVHPNGDFGLIMGNEAHGMADNLLKLTDENLYIPMRGKAESLNVAVSAGILMFALNR